MLSQVGFHRRNDTAGDILGKNHFTQLNKTVGLIRSGGLWHGKIVISRFLMTVLLLLQ